MTIKNYGKKIVLLACLLTFFISSFQNNTPIGFRNHLLSLFLACLLYLLFNLYKSFIKLFENLFIYRYFCQLLIYHKNCVLLIDYWVLNTIFAMLKASTSPRMGCLSRTFLTKEDISMKMEMKI